jgi:hypothetical protein
LVVLAHTEFGSASPRFHENEKTYSLYAPGY